MPAKGCADPAKENVRRVRRRALLLRVGLAGWLTGCAVPPPGVQYVSVNATMPLEQVEAICRPAGDDVTCISDPMRGSVMNCQPRPSSGGATAGDNHAAASAREAAFEGCLAEHGWVRAIVP